MKREPANAYFDTSLLYTKIDFAQSFWTFSSLPLWYEQALLSDAVWNETHWRDPGSTSSSGDAQGAPDEDDRHRALASDPGDPVRARAATSSGPTRTSSTAPRRTCRESCRARSSTSAAGTTGTSGSRDVDGAGSPLTELAARRPTRRGRRRAHAFSASSLRRLAAGRRHALRRLDAHLRRHRGAAGRRGERRARPDGVAGAARRDAGGDGPRPPAPRALPRLARRPPDRRSRQLGGRLRGGRRGRRSGTQIQGEDRQLASSSPRSRRCS